MPESPLATAVTRWYDENARDLPWRAPGTSAWGVLVSEVMLQQTPVVRVEPAWRAWMARWPTPAALAARPAGRGDPDVGPARLPAPGAAAARVRGGDRGAARRRGAGRAGRAAGAARRRRVHGPGRGRVRVRPAAPGRRHQRPPGRGPGGRRQAPTRGPATTPADLAATRRCCRTSRPAAARASVGVHGARRADLHRPRAAVRAIARSRAVCAWRRRPVRRRRAGPSRRAAAVRRHRPAGARAAAGGRSGRRPARCRERLDLVWHDASSGRGRWPAWSRTARELAGDGTSRRRALLCSPLAPEPAQPADRPSGPRSARTPGGSPRERRVTAT